MILRQKASAEHKLPLEVIRVQGAKVHNLRNIDVEIPLDQLTVVTGVSGCGKSSLAYDTIFAEGRRRYLESLSTYSSQFLTGLEPVDVDSIEGLPPTLSVAQHPGSVHRRSTVGTLTEIQDVLRVLYSRAGLPHCPRCGCPISQCHPAEIIERILTLESGRKAMILAPLVRGKKGAHAELLKTMARQGFVRMRINGEMYDLSEPPALPKGKPHTIELVVDRIVIKEGLGERLQESVHLALKEGGGSCLVVVQTDTGWEDHLYSSQFVCTACGLSLPEIEPRSFSFNSPYGACPTCSGLGIIEPSDQNATQSQISGTCPECQGQRLNPTSRIVTAGGISLPNLCELNLDEMFRKIEEWDNRIQSGKVEEFKEGTSSIVMSLIPQLRERVSYLRRVGLGYLSLNRPAVTLSGGELQRVRLAECLGNQLTGACYILDEPTSGLHPIDTKRLLEVMCELRDQGNTLIVIEHDLQIIADADHLIELGPGAGEKGGQLTAEGTPKIVRENPDSVTGPFLRASGRAVPSPNRPCENVPQCTLTGAKLHNLKSVNLSLPLGRMICVTGVSGSGKSSLMTGCLMPLLKQRVAENHRFPPSTANSVSQQSQLSGILSGHESLTRVVEIDQSPLGRSSRSCPATASGIWNEVRRLFAATRESRTRGFSSKRFSMLSPEGRCPECRGSGRRRLSMEFLSDAEICCPACRGARFNTETLSIRYKGQNADDILRMSFGEACTFFANQERILSITKTFSEVGLDYLQLGQSGNTLSGGESQRVKLASALAAKPVGKMFYFLDEPTTGLHSADVRRLIDLLQRLVDQGHTIVVIEHQMDIISAADWIVELGPGGGPEGGSIVETGTPATLLSQGKGVTAEALRTWFKTNLD